MCCNDNFLLSLSQESEFLCLEFDEGNVNQMLKKMADIQESIDSIVHRAWSKAAWHIIRHPGERDSTSPFLQTEQFPLYCPVGSVSSCSTTSHRNRRCSDFISPQWIQCDFRTCQQTLKEHNVYVALYNHHTHSFQHTNFICTCPHDFKLSNHDDVVAVFLWPYKVSLAALVFSDKGCDHWTEGTLHHVRHWWLETTKYLFKEILRCHMNIITRTTFSHSVFSLNIKQTFETERVHVKTDIRHTRPVWVENVWTNSGWWGKQCLKHHQWYSRKCAGCGKHKIA